MSVRIGLKSGIKTIVKYNDMENVFNDSDFLIGKNIKHDFLLIAPFFNETNWKVEHQTYEIYDKKIIRSYVLDNNYEEFNFLKTDFETIDQLFLDLEMIENEIYNVFLKECEYLNRGLIQDDIIWTPENEIIRIKSLLSGTQQFLYDKFMIGFVESKMIIDLNFEIDKIGSWGCINALQENKTILLTEDSYMKGYELANKKIKIIKERLEELYLQLESPDLL